MAVIFKVRFQISASISSFFSSGWHHAALCVVTLVSFPRTILENLSIKVLHICGLIFMSPCLYYRPSIVGSIRRLVSYHLILLLCRMDNISKNLHIIERFLRSHFVVDVHSLLGEKLLSFILKGGGALHCIKVMRVNATIVH